MPPRKKLGKSLSKKGEGISIRLGQMEESCDLVFAVDKKSRLTYVGRSLSRLLGRRKRELFGKRITGLFLGTERRDLARAIAVAADDGETKHVTLKLGDGRYSFCVISAGEDSSQLAFLGHRRISAEKELRMARLARVVECMEESVCLTDLDHNILYINPAMTRLYGFTRDEMEGKKSTVFFENIPGNPKNLAERARMEACGKSWQKEIFGRKKDGTIFPIILLLDVVRDENGRTIGYVGVSQDITEQKRLHGQLMQAEKMAAIGQLADGLAHEFNNLIAIISGRAQFARSKGTEAEKDKAIDAALRMCERASTITNNLLSFVRQFEPMKELSDVADIMEQILPMVSRDMRANKIRIVRRYGKVPRLLMDRAQMQQVFINIIINARHSMLSGGTLTISIRKDGRYVSIAFSDTGSGIDRKLMNRIFEPFVTTKGPIGCGNLPGYGLRLAVSYGIVKRHDGEIAVKSASGKGSTFTIKLPIAAPGRSRRGGHGGRRAAATDVKARPGSGRGGKRR